MTFTPAQPSDIVDVPTSDVRVTAIVPARNEAACIATVVLALIEQRDARGRALLHEVLVVDNGSTDGTGDIARRCGARVIEVAQAGYGRACWEAAQASVGDVLLFVDGDGAADPREAGALLIEIHRGADLVIGVRLNPRPGSMTPPQRWGNRLACALMRLVWGVPADDLGPYRAIRRGAFDALDLRDRAYGWTVEMQMRAHRIGLRVVQVPVSWQVRLAGRSKISGTVRGVLGAGFGMVGVIGRLWLQERHRPEVEPRRFRAAPHAAAPPVETL